MRVGVVGSRRRDTDLDRALVFHALDEYGPGLTVVSGGCKKGADAFAKEYAKSLGLEYIEYRPRTDPPVRSYGEAVQRYHYRNRLIAENCDILIALVADDRTGGTENTIKHARRAGTPVHIL